MTSAGRDGLWTRVLLVGVPFACLPVKLLITGKAGWCAFSVLWMALYWMLEPIPLAVTALMPLVLFPLLDILGTMDTARTYFNDLGFVIFASLVLASAMNASNLHTRLALKALLLLGTNNQSLCLAFMLTTMALSMWIPGTLAVCFMLPVAAAALEQAHSCSLVLSRTRVRIHELLPLDHEGVLTDEDAVTREGVTAPELGLGPAGHPSNTTRLAYGERTESLATLHEDSVTKVKKVMLLSVAYAANIGGSGTLIGTTGNLVLARIIERRFPESEDVTFSSWMLCNVPPMLACVLLGWTYIQWLLRSVASHGLALNTGKETKEIEKSNKIKVDTEIKRKYKDLNRLSFQETVVLTVFFVIAVIWTYTEIAHPLQSASDLPSTSAGAPPDDVAGSSAPMMAAVILLFVIPKDPRNPMESPSILAWDDVNNRLPWSVILLVCAGTSVSMAAETTGLSAILFSHLEPLASLHPGVAVSLICLASSFITEVFSSSALSFVMVPVVVDMAIAAQVHPLYFCIPATVGASFGFMLPTATPPNAVVYFVAKLRIRDMVQPGLVMTVICVLVEFVSINTVGSAVFKLYEFPEWAKEGHRSKWNISLTPT